MPAPRWLAKSNKHVLNRVTRFLAPWAPGWVLIVHRGRRSGRVYKTPVWAFRRGDGYVVALTYGADSDWVRNVLAAQGCDLVARGRHYRAVNPRVFEDDQAGDVPTVIGAVLRRVIRAPEFLRLDVVADRDAG